MTLKYLKRLTALFSYPDDSDISLDENGVGLGLNICKKIVHNMKGSIHVRSQKGHGTCFNMKVSIGVRSSSFAGSWLTQQLMGKMKSQIGSIEHMNNIS
jgi:light-regulated signal transduction histidine kinase (bacteriophytochrome)